jgi:diguanylate cyclase (GGDEF)-like protein
MSTSSTPPPRLDAAFAKAESAYGNTWTHDLRGPISVIRGHARLLIDGAKGELTEEQQKSVLMIDRQAQKLGAMLGELDNEDVPLPDDPALVSGVFPTESLTSPRILIAEDDDEIRGVLGELLASHYRLTFAKDGGEALAALRSQPFHLAIVDLHLPVLDGFEVAQAIHASNDRGAQAFMFLSAQANPQTKVRALALGAADYVTKPFDPDELMARIARIVATVTREASLRADALTDPLTGLANYRSLAQSLERELERSRRYEQPLSLITLDLDHLKAINDEHGHDAGNDAIRLVAQVLKGAVRKFEVVARQGGDEFAVLLPNTGGSEAQRLAERLRAEIGALSLRGVPLTASIGVASRERGRDLEAAALMKASDGALYRAKRAGRDRVEITPG